jgi:hypothetical protein
MQPFRARLGALASQLTKSSRAGRLALPPLVRATTPAPRLFAIKDEKKSTLDKKPSAIAQRLSGPEKVVAPHRFSELFDLKERVYVSTADAPQSRMQLIRLAYRLLPAARAAWAWSAWMLFSSVVLMSSSSTARSNPLTPSTRSRLAGPISAALCTTTKSTCPMPTRSMESSPTSSPSILAWTA